MKLDFSFDTHEQLWIDGPLPPAIKQGKDRKVKVQFVDGESDSRIPDWFSISKLLPGERPWPPLQHEVTLLLEYPHSTLAKGQIRIPLSSEAIAQIRPVQGDGYNYELTLKGVELTNKTPKRSN